MSEQRSEQRPKETVCVHKSTGSCSPDGIYLYVVCMDCREILNESEKGRALRLACPGYEEKRYESGRCKHCYHDAMHHIRVLNEKLRAAHAK